MKAAVVTGICVERDAISAAAAGQAEMLAEIDGIEAVTLIAHAHGRVCEVPTLAVPNSWELLRVLDRLDAELVIFHWGILYDLFNALPITANARRTVVHFHNVTPVHLLPPDRRLLIEQSIRQMQLPALAGVPLWAVSGHNRDTLVEWGYPDEQVRVVPITATLAMPERRPRRATEPVRLLTVGRLVAAKGVDVLVEAMRDVVDQLDHPISLVLAGGSEFSDPEFVRHVRDLIRHHRLGRMIRIKHDLDDSGLAREFSRADVLVSPSLHEGLCVPVIEAYHAGLRVIGSDAGNLPYVVQPPDPVVPVGDPEALAEAILAVVGEVLDGSSHAPPGAADLVRRYSADGVREELVAALADLGAIDPGLNAST
jgi:glycosyltransferase involved in cell wall biosynthesis